MIQTIAEYSILRLFSIRHKQSYIFILLIAYLLKKERIDVCYKRDIQKIVLTYGDPYYYKGVKYYIDIGYLVPQKEKGEIAHQITPEGVQYIENEFLPLFHQEYKRVMRYYNKRVKSARQIRKIINSK